MNVKNKIFTIKLNPEDVTDDSKVVVELYNIGANITTHDCVKKVCNRYEATKEGLSKIRRFKKAIEEVENHLIKKMI